MRTVLQLPGRGIIFMRKVVNRMLCFFLRPLFKSCGRNVRFDASGTYTFKTISVGDDVALGPGAFIAATETTITIGNKVMFGPGVMIRGGNHNTGVLGAFMFDVKKKRPEDDQAVVIEDDVWIGARATILKGVRVGRGAIVGAGAMVTHSVPSYSIVAGVPARVLKYRWSVDDILEHERTLYPEGSRRTRDYLESERRHVLAVGMRQ